MVGATSLNLFSTELFGLYLLEDTYREKHRKLNSSAYKKYEYGPLGRWYIKLTPFKRF